MATNNVILPWYRKVVGSSLIQCSQLSKETNAKTVDTEYTDLPIHHVEIIGLYFTPVAYKSAESNSTEKLIALYKRLNERYYNEFHKDNDHNNIKKKFEIIHIILPTSNTEVYDQQCVINSVKDLPWFTLPLNDIHRQVRLSRRYRVKGSSATLVVVEAPTGRVITSAGCDRLEQDPEGCKFPWRPRPVREVLDQGGLVRGDGGPSTDMNQAVIGVYFSAHWCPPCKAFTPQLVNTYHKVKARGQHFQVIFVSSDRSADSFSQYLATMPWLAVPYEQDERRRELANLFGVQGIPSLVLLDPDGRVITVDGRGEVNEDPEGQNFPWRPKLVNVLNERLAADLHHHPAIVLFVEGDDTELEFAESVLIPAAEEYSRLHAADQPSEDQLQFIIACDCDASDVLREFAGLEDSVPLLTALDMPSGRAATMEDGAEITESSVRAFVQRYLGDGLPWVEIGPGDVHIEQGATSHI